MSAPGKIYSAPLLVNWSLNYSCNFSCEHCYSRFEKAAELPADRVLEAGRRLAQAGVLFANFGGGEPLLRRDLLAVSKELTALGLSLSLNSNGWLLDESAATGLRDAGFVSVGLSLDSHRPEVHDRFRNRPGKFERVVAAAGHLVRAGVKPTDLDGRLPDQSPGTHAAARAGEALGAAEVNLHTFKCSGKGMGASLRTRSGAARMARFLPRGAGFRRKPDWPGLPSTTDLGVAGRP